MTQALANIGSIIPKADSPAADDAVPPPPPPEALPPR